MKTCPYCGSNLDKLNEERYYCYFCSMSMSESKVKENRDRLDVPFQDFVLDSYIERTTPELMKMSTFELLYLLKMIRGERTSMYHQMSIFHKAGKELQTDQYKGAEKETGRDYMYLTKKMFVVENIIRSRLGYVPFRITENYLVRYLENIKKDKNGPMIIRTERQKTP